MIEFHHVTKRFGTRGGGRVTALDAVDLTIDGGEFPMVVGPSGSGKSTLLFAAGAMSKPTSGQVRLGGTDVYALSASARARLRRERVGFMFQTFNLVPYLGCVDNVALPALLAGSSRRRAHVRARDMLERLGLADRLRHRPAELSVGERQRVALCRCLINDPAVLLVDEPTGNLDPAMGAEVMTLLREVNATGQTIIMATHDHELVKHGTRVLVLDGGRLVDDPEPYIRESAA